MKDTTKADGRRSVALWFGVLAGPAAWSIQLLIGGELPEFGCAPGAGAQEVYGWGIEALIRAATALLAVVTLSGGIVSYGCWRRARRDATDADDRAAWMGLAGVMTNVVFFVIIVLGFTPTFYLSGCGRSL
jgi:hypothetical protein